MNGNEVHRTDPLFRLPSVHGPELGTGVIYVRLHNLHQENKVPHFRMQRFEPAKDIMNSNSSG